MRPSFGLFDGQKQASPFNGPDDDLLPAVRAFLCCLRHRLHKRSTVRARGRLPFNLGLSLGIQLAPPDGFGEGGVGA